MADVNASSNSNRRVQAHRARLRAKGLRPIQLWVPDVRRTDFVDQAHHQSAALASSKHAGDDQAFIDSITPDEW